MKVLLQSFGCKVNAIETESLAMLLCSRGWERCTRPEEADAIILNSCTVTASGDHRMLTALRKLRSAAPEAVIVLTGCYVQAFPEQAASLAEADLLVGTKERQNIPLLLEEYLHTGRRCTSIVPHRKGDAFETLPTGSDTEHTRAFLKIQDGCNRFCTYCIIPYARGRCRSKKLAELQEEARKLHSKGFREIVLCGINLACYGQDEGLTIADAVDACSDAGLERVRLGSLEPEGLTNEVLAALAANSAFCPQFHISLQSGCDRTLQAMGRHYSCGDYAALVQKIRTLFPGCAVTTDLMTGFPGETEEDFRETLRFAEEMQFAKIHIFRYSRRPGTAADRMPDQIPEAVKKQRAEQLTALAHKLRDAHLQSCLGRNVQVLFEREKNPAFHRGHAPDYSTVLVPAAPEDGSFRNRIADVTITEIRDGQLLGILA